jgi:hypothetical protein
MYVRTHARTHVCMDEWMDGCMHVCFNLHQLQFQHINATFMEVVALIRRMFLCLVTKLSD